jgi:hypothetical protein
MMSKKIKILLYLNLIFGLILVLPIQLYAWGFGLSLNLDSQHSLKPIHSMSSDIYLGGHALTRNYVENFVRRYVGEKQAVQADHLQKTIYYCPKSEGIKLNNTCDSKVFLGAFSPININGSIFYVTARHVLSGTVAWGEVIIDPSLNLNNYNLFDFKLPASSELADQDNSYADLLVLVPRDFIVSQCTNNIMDRAQVNSIVLFDADCGLIIKERLKEQFSEPNAKTFWLALQPLVTLESALNGLQSHVSWHYSAGLVNSVEPLLDQNIEVQPNQPIISLVKNISNHSLPGTSGSLLKELDIDNNKLGANIAIVLCEDDNFTFALNVSKLLTDSEVHTHLTSITELINEHAHHNNKLNIKCTPTDGRKGGGY